MFSNLADFAFVRSGKQAIGFYIAYLFLIVLASMVAGGLYGLVTGVSSFNTGVRIGNIMAVILCALISLAIVLKKRMLPFQAITMVLLSAALAVFFGGLGGLIPISYLTTVKINPGQAQ